VQSDPVEKDVAALRAQKPTGLAEDVAVKRSPGAEIATQPVKPAARDVTVAKPPDENCLDWPTHPSRAYSLAYVAVSREPHCSPQVAPLD
jgi:hypothetical protein